MSKYDIYRDWQELDPRETLVCLLHDLRHPTATIHGYATLLRTESENMAGLPAEFREWLDKLVEGADDLHELLDTFTSPQQRL